MHNLTTGILYTSKLGILVNELTPKQIRNNYFQEEDSLQSEKLSLSNIAFYILLCSVGVNVYMYMITSTQIETFVHKYARVFVRKKINLRHLT